MNIIVPDRYTFDGCYINDVYIHPVAAFVDYDKWYGALIDLIPLMHDEYIELFFECGFQPFIFLRMAQWLPSIRKDGEDLTDVLERIRSAPAEVRSVRTFIDIGTQQKRRCF